MKFTEDIWEFFYKKLKIFPKKENIK